MFDREKNQFAALLENASTNASTRALLAKQLILCNNELRDGRIKWNSFRSILLALSAVPCAETDLLTMILRKEIYDVPGAQQRDWLTLSIIHKYSDAMITQLRQNTDDMAEGEMLDTYQTDPDRIRKMIETASHYPPNQKVFRAKFAKLAIYHYDRKGAHLEPEDPRNVFPAFVKEVKEQFDSVADGRFCKYIDVAARLEDGFSPDMAEWLKNDFETLAVARPVYESELVDEDEMLLEIEEAKARQEEHKAAQEVLILQTKEVEEAGMTKRKELDVVIAQANAEEAQVKVEEEKVRQQGAVAQAEAKVEEEKARQPGIVAQAKVEEERIRSQTSITLAASQKEILLLEILRECKDEAMKASLLRILSTDLPSLVTDTETMGQEPQNAVDEYHPQTCKMIENGRIFSWMTIACILLGTVPALTMAALKAH